MLILFVTGTLVSVCAQNTTVKGSVKGLTDGMNRMVVACVQGNKVLPVDTVAIESGGKYNFKVRIETPTMYLLSFMGIDRSVTHVMLAPKDNVTIDMEYDREINYMRITESKGSRDAELYRQFNQLLYVYARQTKAIDDEYSLPSTSDSRREELGMQFQQVQTDQNVAVRQLLSKNTDVLMSAFLVTYFDKEIETYYDLFESIENGLKGKYGDNQFVQYVSSKLRTSLGAGRMAPEIEMKDPDGKTRKLSDLRGNVVMIDFWASWCRPCRMENPNVVKLYHKYHDKGFEIYSVSLDKNHADWVRAIDADGLVWPNHVSDLNGWTSSGGASYGITSVPSTVLVDRQGRIIARNLRGADLERKLKEIFGE